MAPQDDLTAERAAIQSFYYCLHAGVEGGEFQERYEQEDIGKIVALVRKTRQEALREAARAVNDYNCRHNHGKKATKACDDIFEALDRLASDGG